MGSNASSVTVESILGKGVDNDFAAVLIREYDAGGQKETDATRTSPLVAAEWYPVGMTNVNRQSLVHGAQSDEFTLRPGRPGQPLQGRAVVWLIYADFMDARVPDAWPRTLEFAGGHPGVLRTPVGPGRPRAGSEPSSDRAQGGPRVLTGNIGAPQTRSAADSKSTARLSL